MNVQLLFPIPIANFTFESELTSEEKKILCNLEQKNNLYNTTSVDKNILDNPKLIRLKNFFSLSINRYLNEIMMPDHDCELYITQSWVNYTKPKQKHHRHNHPNSVLSGVFYINADSERDRIYFYRKDPAHIRIYPKQYNNINSDSWWIPVSTGLLILFPSSIDHEVAVIDKGITRISLSFNTFVKGEIGSESNLDQLILGEQSGKSI